MKTPGTDSDPPELVNGTGIGMHVHLLEMHSPAMRVLAIVVLLGLLVFPGRAQTIWSRPYEANQFAVEAIVPDASDDASLLTGATFITGTLSLNDNVELAAELPIARYGASGAATSSTTGVGNPYLGVGLSSTSIPVLFQFGARIPAAPSNAATQIGSTADVGRLSAFGPEELVISGLLNGRLPVGHYSTLRLRFGLGYASYPVAGRSSRDRDWRMQYEAQLWREGDRLITGLTFAGRATVTHPGGTQHHGAVSVMGNWTRLQPGIVVGTGLNDLVQDGDFVPFAGLTLSVTYMR